MLYKKVIVQLLVVKVFVEKHVIRRYIKVRYWKKYLHWYRKISNDTTSEK